MRFSLALLAALAGCSSMDNTSDQHPPAHDVTIAKGAVNLGANAFSPATFSFSIAAGTHVRWYNADLSGSGSYGGSTGVTHRLISDDGTTFHSAPINPGGVFTATFSQVGVFPYHCEIHPTMSGTITVNP